MATDWAGLMSQALQKYNTTNAALNKQDALARTAQTRSLGTLADQNKLDVQRAARSAVDRGMVFSGAHKGQQQNVLNAYNASTDKVRTGTTNTINTIKRNRTLALDAYKKQKANIQKQQQAESLRRIAQLPAGINFAALKAMTGK